MDVQKMLGGGLLSAYNKSTINARTVVVEIKNARKQKNQLLRLIRKYLTIISDFLLYDVFLI